MLAATATVIVATGQSPAAIVLLSLTVVAASFVGLSVYRSLLPLVAPETIETPTMVGGRTRAALEREKTLVLRSIKELEFDFAMRKIAQSDFDEMSARLRSRAVGLMRQLETGGGYRTDIEKELQARLAEGTTSAKATAVEKARATTKDDVARSVSSACPCGTSNDPDARFCKNCGSKLVGAA